MIRLFPIVSAWIQRNVSPLYRRVNSVYILKLTVECELVIILVAELVDERSCITIFLFHIVPLPGTGVPGTLFLEFFVHRRIPVSHFISKTIVFNSDFWRFAQQAPFFDGKTSLSNKQFGLLIKFPLNIIRRAQKML